MNNYSHIFLAFALLFAGCSDVDNMAPVINVTTVSAESIGTETGQRYILLKGKVGGDVSDNVQGDAYFYYSDKFSKVGDIIRYGDRIVAGKISATSLDFSAELWPVKIVTDYNCVAVVDVKGNDYCGEVKSFKSFGLLTEVTTTWDDSGDANSATIVGHAVYDMSVSEPELFFLYSTETDNLDSLKRIGHRLEGTISVFYDGMSSCQFKGMITGIIPNTKYYYVAALKQENREFYGEVHYLTRISH